MQGFEPLLEHTLKLHACLLLVLAQKLRSKSFSLQAELNRRRPDLTRRCRVVLEELKRLAERCCGNLSFTEYNSGAHKPSPALGVMGRILQAIGQASDHRPDRSVALELRHCFSVVISCNAWCGGLRL